jgi:HEAT repeat protein
MSKRQRKQPNMTISTSLVQQTQLLIETMTDYARFQRLADELLSAHFGYRIHPRGVSARGTVRGQPDSWGYTPDGRFCALAYGTSPQWKVKLQQDLKNVYQAVLGTSLHSQLKVFVFCTNRHIDADNERDLITQVGRDYGWELRLIGSAALAIPLDTEWQDIRYRYFGIRVEHHNWRSLLEASSVHRKMIYKQYESKYDPSLYVPRHVEQTVDAWYRSATHAFAQGRGAKQLLILVDQAGTGKSNLVLHLAEEYGKIGPVIILPGTATITDGATLEHLIVDAIKDTANERTYHSDLKALCRLSQREGQPILVILDGINENDEPKRVRQALKQFLAETQGKTLLVLLTCRDATWPHLNDPLFHNFAHIDGNPNDSQFTVQLGPYTDDEFQLACTRYFTRWGVEVSLGPDAAHMLRLPLLLRIFAEAYQHSRPRYLPRLSESDLWREYLKRKIADIWEGMDHHLDQEAIKQCIEALAEKMLERGVSSLALDDLTSIPHLRPFDTSRTSLMSQLQNAAVLLGEQDEEQSSRFSFVYEAFLEFLLSEIFVRLLKQPNQRERILSSLEQLALGYRWRQVPLLVASGATDPDALIERLSECNLWLAAHALIRATSRTSTFTHQKIIDLLVSQLGSIFALDRRRACELLGLLKVTECKGLLLQCWQRDKHLTMLLALARLEAEEVMLPLIKFLQGPGDSYRAQVQALVDDFSEDFRRKLKEQALLLLSDEAQGSAAVHALGYLRMSDTILPLLAYLERAAWSDGDALVALLRIGTPEANEALMRTIDAAGAWVPEDDYQPFTSPNPHSALEQLRVYGFQHSVHKAVVPLLVQLLEHPSYYVRYEVVLSLKILGAAEAIVPLIISAAKMERERHLDSEIRMALHELGPRSDVDALLALVQDSTTPDAVLPYVIEALGASRDERAFEPLASFARQRRFLFETVQALGRLGQPSTIAVLTELLDAEDIAYGPETIVRREFLEELIITALGRLYHPSAFEAVESNVRCGWPRVALHSISALVATGSERAMPLLRDLWHQATEHQTENRKVIIGCLLWLGTDGANDLILELLSPHEIQNVTILVTALMRGGELLFLNSTIPPGPVDDRFIAIVRTYFDELNPEDQWCALIALDRIATPAARDMLEHIATAPVYSCPWSCTTRPEFQTLRQAATQLLSFSGATSMVDTVLDELTGSHPSFIELRLSKMERESVIVAIRNRLPIADEVVLARLLELLGWFGGTKELSDVRPYIHNPRLVIANAAYEAEQRILKLIEFE